MEEKIERLKCMIAERYNHVHCGYTEQRSEGNFSDVFEDGMNCGFSDALYLVACILGIEEDLELEAPEEPEYEF